MPIITKMLVGAFILTVGAVGLHTVHGTFPSLASVAAASAEEPEADGSGWWAYSQMDDACLDKGPVADMPFGPADYIKYLRSSGSTYEVEDKKSLLTGSVIQSKIIVQSADGSAQSITYYRGKARCETAAHDRKAAKEAAEQADQDRYGADNPRH